MKKLRQAIKQARWTQTTYIKPHEYVLEPSYPNLFAHMEQELYASGYDAMFMNKMYRYINIEGYKYWIVGNVLNRERLETGDK